MNLRRIVGQLALSAGLVAGMAASAGAWPYEIPAKWVGHGGPLGDAIRPMVNMTLDDVDYVSGKGIMINGTAILRIDDEGKPYVTLGTRDPAPNVRGAPMAVTWAPKAGLVMVVGCGAAFRPEKQGEKVVRIHRVGCDQVLQRREGKWRVAPLPDVPSAPREWTMWRLLPARDGGVYGIVTNRGPMTITPDIPRPRLDGIEWISRLYHFDGEVWRDRTPSWVGLVEFSTVCRLSDHEIALAGRSITVRADGFLDRFDPWMGIYDEANGDFTQLPRPPFPAGVNVLRARFPAAACDSARGRLWAAADYVMHEVGPRALNLFSIEESRLYSYEGSQWRAFDLPERPAEEIPDPDNAFRHVLAVAVSPDGSPWLSLETDNARTEPLWRLTPEGWRSYPLPEIRGVKFYYPQSMAFDPRGEGWATATLFGGGEAYPLLLHFHDDRWEQQNWTWSWWRQRGFGLFGQLR